MSWCWSPRGPRRSSGSTRGGDTRASSRHARPRHARLKEINMALVKRTASSGYVDGSGTSIDGELEHDAARALRDRQRMSRDKSGSKVERSAVHLGDIVRD